MSGTRWCQGTCVSGPGPVLELWGFISYRLLCNKGLLVSSSRQDTYHHTLSGGPCCRSRHPWGFALTWEIDWGRTHLPVHRWQNSFVCELRAVMNI